MGIDTEEEYTHFVEEERRRREDIAVSKDP